MDLVSYTSTTPTSPASAYPADVMLIERLEYGDAIGLPVTLQIKGEGTLPATDAEFTSRLQTLVTEVNQRREAIKAIEQKDIGRINAKMDDLRLQQRALERAQRARHVGVR